ncbi:hypothetical protein GQ42DRAFT_181264 [Ramicandelaber brevisporus]|nr:hypothetical protein GQ42DRAFT_181264 [Ramicandelaber brevisporus]
MSDRVRDTQQLYLLDLPHELLEEITLYFRASETKVFGSEAGYEFSNLQNVRVIKPSQQPSFKESARLTLDWAANRTQMHGQLVNFQWELYIEDDAMFAALCDLVDGIQDEAQHSFLLSPVRLQPNSCPAGMAKLVRMMTSLSTLGGESYSCFMGNNHSIDHYNTFPQLNRLSLSDIMKNITAIYDLAGLTPERLPSLQCITLVDPFASASVAERIFKHTWYSINELVLIYSYDTLFFHSINGHLPNLAKLRLQYCACSINVNELSTQFPQLQSLVIQSSEVSIENIPDPAANVSEHVLTNLKEFAVTGDYSAGYSQVFPGMMALVFYGAPKLETIRFIGYTLSDEVLEEFEDCAGYQSIRTVIISGGHRDYKRLSFSKLGKLFPQMKRLGLNGHLAILCQMKRELDQDADQSVTAISKRVASDRPKPGLLDLPHKVLTKIAYYVCEWKPRLLTVSRTFNEVFPATVWYSFEQEDWQIRRRITASAWSHYGHFVRRALISLESDWYLPANMIPNVVYLEVMLQRLEDVFGPNSGNKLAHLRHVKITSAIKGRLYKKHAKMVARFANAAAKRPHPVKFEYDLSVRSNEELIAMTELAHAIVDTSHHKFTIVIGRAYPHPPKGMAKLAAMMYEIRVIGLDTLNGLLGYHDCTFPNLHILYLWGENLKPERFPILRRLKGYK